ncbi:hypothetical protein LF1_33240 [Rubripirellula obstinata]|uniref:Uncharacterized protein n=1 Tax=Rubripirellula obstinata TaxID=406547 RepID=A0A5B1CN47_9BACT|nr:hypothetical protein LF1_33240 [Rubripirellula obstinata]
MLGVRNDRFDIGVVDLVKDPAGNGSLTRSTTIAFVVHSSFLSYRLFIKVFAEFLIKVFAEFLIKVFAEFLIKVFDLGDFQFREPGDGSGIHRIDERSKLCHFVNLDCQPHAVFVSCDGFTQR